jgi:hypothetical protein
MLTEDGNLTEVVDVMQYAWTGEWPENRTPQVESMLLDGKAATDSVTLTSGQTYEAVIYLRDPEGDALTYRLELKPESTSTAAGGDYEEPLTNLEGALSDSGAASTTLTAPAPGKYRLFVYASDAGGRIAHANIPFLVRE